MNHKRQTSRWGVVVSASVKGASHEASGTCCQDAASVKEGFFRGIPYLVCSVADGHGSAEFTHSDRGAALAVLASEQTAMQLMMILAENQRTRKKTVEQYVSTNLKEAWVDHIRQSMDCFRVPANVLRKYGTTLLTVLLYGERAYMAQLGDGAICTVNPDGQANFLVEPETGPINNLADSLCCPDANTRWAFASIPLREIRTLMISTDGLVNSLVSNEGYIELANTLDAHMRNIPPSQIKQALPAWLGNYSKQGSGDDISVVTIAMNEIQNN